MASRAETRARAAGYAPAGGIITHFADPAEMAAWLERALPRTVLVYASGPNLGGGKHPAAALARSWSDAGLVALYSQRNGDGFRFCAKKLERRVVSATAPLGLSADWQDGDEGAIFRLLEDCAAGDLPCPSNDAIAETLNLRDRYAARYRFDRLVVAGLVRVIEPNRFTARVIEIAATGARTRASTGDAK